ncbi:hypothetical protein WJX72_002225 [[Myrmecia] bisecta]|uniref:F-box domain-containing protein n=1 Tax=[Myrmecia] bisecta TaxID=41462 RepID=A0AAW1PRU8_9CHLO
MPKAPPHLPDELCQLIAQLLEGDPLALSALRLVSKQWQRAIQQGITRLDIRVPKLQRPVHADRLLLFPNLAHIKLEAHYASPCTAGSAVAWLQLVPRLTSLDIEELPDSACPDLVPLLAHLTGLQTLSVHHAPTEEDVAVFDTAPLTALTRLEHLHLLVTLEARDAWQP